MSLLFLSHHLFCMKIQFICIVNLIGILNQRTLHILRQSQKKLLCLFILCQQIVKITHNSATPFFS